MDSGIVSAFLSLNDTKLFQKLILLFAFFIPGAVYQTIILGVSPAGWFDWVQYIVSSILFSLPFLFMGLLLWICYQISQPVRNPAKDYEKFLKENLENKKINSVVFADLSKFYLDQALDESAIFLLSFAGLLSFAAVFFDWWVWGVFNGNDIVLKGLFIVDFWEVFLANIIICILIFYFLNSKSKKLAGIRKRLKARFR
ncbi:MAG: hypothetical protein WC821_00720 [archaeon]|jgi:hypothetical protein